MDHPEKLPDLMNVISDCLVRGAYLDTRHASDRQSERDITREEILQVLRHGYHEKRKDRFEERFSAWNYAVRGKTVDRRGLRVIVSFDKAGMMIITAIAFDKRR
jgi:hypothetical protein